MGALDTLDLQVEVNEKIFCDSAVSRNCRKLKKELPRNDGLYLGITARVKLVEPNTLQKAGQKIIDKRRF